MTEWLGGLRFLLHLSSNVFIGETCRNDLRIITKINKVFLSYLNGLIRYPYVYFSPLLIRILWLDPKNYYWLITLDKTSFSSEVLNGFATQPLNPYLSYSDITGSFEYPLDTMAFTFRINGINRDEYYCLAFDYIKFKIIVPAPSQAKGELLVELSTDTTYDLFFDI